MSQHKHNFILHEELNQFDLTLFGNQVNLLLSCLSCKKDYVGTFKLKRFYENKETD